MLRLSLDKTSGEIKVLEGLVKTAPSRTLRLSLFSGGIAAQLASGESLTISAKPAGQTEADVLFSCTLTSSDYNTSEALYLKTFTAYTTAALALLDLSDSNAKTDQASLVVDGYMSFTASGGDPVEYDQTYELTLAAVKALPSDGTPQAVADPDDWLTARAVRYDIAQSLSAPQKLQASSNLGNPGSMKNHAVNGVFTATINDLNTVFTDANASGVAQLNLPTFADAMAHGGVIEVYATRNYAYDNNYICVYSASSERTPNRFLIGSSVLYSLYSTGKGDYLRLQPITIDGTHYWQVLDFMGFWQDRD